MTGEVRVILAALLLATIQTGDTWDEASETLRVRIESAPQEVAIVIESRAVCNNVRRDPQRDPDLAAKLSVQFKRDPGVKDERSLIEGISKTA
jgi:hypothetical protein